MCLLITILSHLDERCQCLGCCVVEVVVGEHQQAQAGVLVEGLGQRIHLGAGARDVGR